jgi:hypothetical protein
LRRHKTKFRIVKSNKNINYLSDLICEFINENKKNASSEIISMPKYEKNALFPPNILDFADELIEEK